MLENIVNVATVPQRSPFRYPGGKTWLVPQIRKWLKSLPPQSLLFIEPFAGGASASLAAAFEGLTAHSLIVECDKEVASVWQVIIWGDATNLADRIVKFNLTTENLDAALATDPVTWEELAFQTILRNRTNRGGILAPGVGRIKNGENGRGLLSRWYPETLSKRILAIAEIKNKFSIIQDDGLKVIRNYIDSPDSVVYLDPPYTASVKRACGRLYRHNELDHYELFSLASKFRGDFLMSYDNAPEIYDLARQFNFDTVLVPMKSSHHVEMYELLIGRNLDWSR
jgi:DNA adenine methylase